MRRNHWHTLRDEQSLCVTRRLPVVFDVAAHAGFPVVRRGRLAHQIRQDLWRMLQGVRGFSPAVKVERDGTGLQVTAGGSIAATSFPKARIEARIAALLSCPGHRRRWLAQARLTEGT